MALVSDVTTTQLSGQNHIDSLLDNGPGWNWLAPTRNILYYTFSVASGNETGTNSISGGVTEFNAAQQSACLSCSRRLNIDPPCRFNIDPGRVAAV
jgi:serralysin